MEHSTSPAQEGSEANSTILLPTFNLIIPSRPNSPLQLGKSYLESAGLLDESCTQEQSHCGLNWQPDPSFQDHEPPLATSQSIWWQDSSPVLQKNESLEEQLTRALCQHAHKESKGFLPLDKLHELVVEDSVAEALTTYIPGLSLDDARSHAQDICPRSIRDPLQPSFRRMFAILVMIQQPQEILTFVRHNMANYDLPLVKARSSTKGGHELRRKTQPYKALECLWGWSPFLVNSFEEYQWTLLSPFFSRGETYEAESTFAIKRLHSRHREIFSREVDALKRLSGQKHIVPLLATFEYKNSYRLLFPWANANLRRYWAMFPNPSADKRYGLWVAKQCKGMAEGLSIIHDHPADQGDDYAYESVLQPNHSHLQRGSKPAYGRHGDIKPENILWFRNGPNTDIGVLEIADFGLTRFHHRRSRSNISPVGMGNSPTYRAPEFDMPDGPLSRSYDIWALGCLYLEFITWYFLGWNGVTQFSASRETKRNDLSADDCYFELSSSRDTGNICSQVNPAVMRWMAFLRQHWTCSPFFHDFLGLIESGMLVVETNGQIPIRRITAADVKQRMVSFYNRSGSNAAYLSGANPLNDLPVSTMHQLRSCHSEEAQSDAVISETSESTSDLSNHNISTTLTTQETGPEQIRRFACPFFKLNPHKHGKTCSRGWEHIHRLKEHVFRKHTLPDHRCTRCLSHSKDNAALEAHARSITPCALRGSSDSDHITPEQERLLRKRPRRETMSHDADCERWRKIFSILFPGTDQGDISPYNDYSLPSSATIEYSETIDDYSKFLDGGIPSHAQTELQATISRELGVSEVDGRKIVDIIPMLQQTLLQSFQNYKGGLSQG
ncbi:Protein kinase domain-containing protein [Fusarium sp. LHS14.1]|nr:Protein kinase domain-containing protein [Fusarium sp. LHS14.1]